MAIMEILIYPHPFLRVKAAAVTEIDDEIRSLAADMFETMYAARGIGLAATQVGADRRLIVLDVPAGDDEGGKGGPGANAMAVVNPEIVEARGSIKSEEGCLSVPGETAEVRRAERVRLRGLDLDGNEIDMEADGLLAVALQHEVDHLDGVVFIDRLSRLRRDMIKRRLKKRAAEGGRAQRPGAEASADER
ncbi:MAG TPA: peptide deformylase [Deltaproteobacteria bacterium]|nr:peptide deformylase [Deltaproteobacteria bacterium]